ncbi:uncharacterized [Tachysurus ichikawai]
MKHVTCGYHQTGPQQMKTRERPKRPAGAVWRRTRACTSFPVHVSDEIDKRSGPSPGHKPSQLVCPADEAFNVIQAIEVKEAKISPLSFLIAYFVILIPSGADGLALPPEGSHENQFETVCQSHSEVAIWPAYRSTEPRGLTQAISSSFTKCVNANLLEISYRSL